MMHYVLSRAGSTGIQGHFAAGERYGLMYITVAAWQATAAGREAPFGSAIGAAQVASATTSDGAR